MAGSWWMVLPVAVVLAACADERASPQGEGGTPASVLSEDARSELDLALDRCSAASGYDPEVAETLALGENDLAEGELEFRDCAYAALTEIVRPSLRLPALLDELISVDRQLTAAIPLGGATRSTRKASIDQTIAQIREQETAIREAETAAAAPLAADELQRQRQQRDLVRFRQQMDIVNRLF